MGWHCEKTHRCAGSLAAKVGIRKNATRFRYTSRDDIREGWTLWCIKYDIDYDCYHNNCVATIIFCPFCGKRLED